MLPPLEGNYCHYRSCVFLASRSIGEELAQRTPYFSGADVNHVLVIYEQLSGFELIVDSRVTRLHAPVTFCSLESVSIREALTLFERSFLKQAGVVVARLEDGQAWATYNDVLPITPGQIDLIPVKNGPTDAESADNPSG